MVLLYYISKNYNNVQEIFTFFCLKKKLLKKDLKN